MAWTTPRTWTTGEVVTAAIMNADHRDNLVDLDRRTTVAQNYIANFETTASTSFTDLTTAGPAVTVVLGATVKAIVAVSAGIGNSSAFAAGFMSWATTGASTSAASDDHSVAHPAETASGQGCRVATYLLWVGTTSGSTTFTAKYRASSGTASFIDRRIVVIPQGS